MPEIDALLESLLLGNPKHQAALLRLEHADPHRYLGPHEATREVELGESQTGLVVRAWQPKAESASLVLEDAEHTMHRLAKGLFAVFVPGKEVTEAYRLRFTFQEDGEWMRDDPYRFPCSLDEEALYFISEGTHRRLWEDLGAQPVTLGGRDGLEEVSGYRFAVWAPNARRVSVVGDFCGWDPRVYPMRRLGSSGVWEIFLPEVSSGSMYKFEILTAEGPTLAKADPMASWAERSPGTASRLFRSDFAWGDGDWQRDLATKEQRREPMAIYEVHLGSWAGGGGARVNYRQLAPQLVEHVKALGFNYLELMPVAEHPFDGSWGYQITGYFAPTSRFGDPDDFRFFVDYCHRHGVGVILDWVPAHFVKDAHGLGRFDGTALYEHEDPKRGEHPDWGTYIFNYGRFEVKNFLVANALYWFDAFHIDGLRVDAVASMLYLDYSREEGQWIPNEQGGRENLEAVALLREVSRLTHELYPGRFLVAEESTAWPGVTEKPEAGGLGFDFKWNMGWMHDTLGFFGIDPLFRSSSHDSMTFGMVYEYSEAYVNPLSHDEVVHGKGSLLTKMAGDPWRQHANLRALLAFQFTRPGKVLLFMGSELAPVREWNHETGLDRYLEKDPAHRGVRDLVATLGELYQRHPCLSRLDHEPSGFRWIACHDRGRSVFAYARLAAAAESRPATKSAVRKTSAGSSTPGPVPQKRGKKANSSGASQATRSEPSAKRVASEELGPGAVQLAAVDHLIVVLNLTPVPREGYRLGAPAAASYRVILNTDDKVFGGSGYEIERSVEVENVAGDGLECSMALTLPPLAALVLEPVRTEP